MSVFRSNRRNAGTVLSAESIAARRAVFAERTVLLSDVAVITNPTVDPYLRRLTAESHARELARARRS